jgi:tripartite-type tricarboxylate transporter receptor subunit TctC
MISLPKASVAVAVCLAGGLVASAVAADEVADFYKGRTITIVVGNEAGTGFDIYARTLARHLGSHIPGHPGIIVQNMVGASGVTAANWLYNAAPKDGTVIGTFVHTVPFEPLMGNAAAKYDAAKFTWIGNVESIVGICGVSRSSGITRFDDLFTRETTFGATGATGAIAKFALAIKHLLGAKIKLVPGYKGTASIKLAMERGEVAGICALGMSTVMSSWKDDFDSGAFRPIVQTSGGADPALAGIPRIDVYAKTDADRQLFGLIFGTQALGRPYASTPGVPGARRDALRAAFMATMKDPQFLADADKTKIAISPMDGKEVDAFMARVNGAPPAVIERAKRAVRND